MSTQYVPALYLYRKEEGCLSMTQGVLTVRTKSKLLGKGMSPIPLASCVVAQLWFTGELSLSSIKLRTHTISSVDEAPSLTGKGYSVDLRRPLKPLSNEELDAMAWGATKETKATFINEGGYIETTATKKANVLGIGTSLLGGGL